MLMWRIILRRMKESAKRGSMLEAFGLLIRSRCGMFLLEGR